MEYVKLNNGVMMPILGYGVYLVTPQECERCVSDALAAGYRSIDTAQAYYNEEGVGNAVHKSGIARKDLFLTTKIWVSNAGYERAKVSIDESLAKLQTDYIDLLLIHQPFGDYYGTYRAMEDAYREGKVRAIGVSNFYPDRFVDLAENVTIKPAVNQIETHVFNQQVQAQDILREYGTQLESWGPLAEGKNDFFTNGTLTDIAKKYGKSVAQIGLRFLIERGIVVIPKSVRKERMAENLNVFDFSLSDDDKQAITEMDEAKTLFIPHNEPEMVRLALNYDKNHNPKYRTTGA
ncbi:aldo/keto reductase [Pedobacter agri]|uniref:aldo/keto reductase n=1 Tax=Pedobacter agri TaxID=454586 RepID=UPI00292F4A13|nr:aldo/keto reductase [Pedobacter agri]